MRLTSEALEQQLAAGEIQPCYVLVGENALLLQETRDSIWKTAHQRYAYTRQIWEINSHFSVEAVKAKNGTIDLFHKCFVELRISEALQKNKGEALAVSINWLRECGSVAVLVISISQPIHKVQAYSWFKKIASLNALVVFENSTPLHLTQRIVKKLHRIGLTLSKEALSLFVQYTEGNLIEVEQIVSKLSLVYQNHDTPLTVSELSEILEDRAQFELFYLTDAILQGDVKKCMRVLTYLQSTQTPTALVLGYLMRILRTIALLRYGLDQSYSFSDLCRQHNVWAKQQGGFKRIVQSIRAKDIALLFELAHHIDQCIKGVKLGSTWHALNKLSLCLASSDITFQKALL